MTGALTLANVASSLTMPELTLGSIPFAGTGGIVSQDNANFFWDNTNNRLGLGTSAPAYLLQIGGNGGLNASLDVQANNGSSWFKIVSGNVTFNAAGGKTIAGGADLGARFNISAINDTYPTLSIRGYTAGVSDIFRVSSPTLATGNLLIIKSTGRVGIGTTSPSAVLHLKAGTATASTAPLKFTSGTLLTIAEAGAVEFLTDDFYATITTGAARKKFVLDDGTALTATRIPFATTNGRLTDDADLTFATDTLSATKVAMSSLTSGRVPFASTAGLLIDDADFTFATDTLTATKIVGTTSIKVGTAAGYLSSDGSAGATGTFTTADAKTVTVKDGIITNIV